MVDRPGAKRPRVFVPLEVGSFLRAPFGWTNRMRRDEGWPERGASKSVRIGLWGNLAVGLALYGGPVLGALVGWQLWGAWIGVAIGLLLGVGVGVAVFGLAALAWPEAHTNAGHDAPNSPNCST
jgi:hypothetical protein